MTIITELPLLYRPRHETLYSAWKGHRGFAQRLIKALQPEVFVELGVHAGDSYFTMVEAMDNGKAYGVDTWAGDEHAGFYDDTIWNMVQGVNKQYPNSTLLRMPFDQAVGVVNEISLLHIDGLPERAVVLRLNRVAVQGVVKRRYRPQGDHSGLSCCSMYCLSTDSGAPPTVRMQ